MGVRAMAGARAEERRVGRGVGYFLLALSCALLAIGLVILWYWLFPVVETTGDSQLIGQNPVGYWLVLAGSGLLLASIALLRRSRPKHTPQGGRLA